MTSLSEQEKLDLITIKCNLNLEAEYDTLTWGSKDTIKYLLEIIDKLCEVKK